MKEREISKCFLRVKFNYQFLYLYLRLNDRRIVLVAAIMTILVVVTVYYMGQPSRQFEEVKTIQQDSGERFIRAEVSRDNFLLEAFTDKMDYHIDTIIKCLRIES